ncbi:MAG: single-stranded DNA-binding protein [Bacteroidetes bacterium]|nr:MAG: single-stranded DNA-binding protein [Bacteroidota bacterium]
MINKVILIGRLGGDPEVRRLENGTVVAKLNLATSESYKDKNGEWQESTEWHNVVLWRYLAEKAERDFKKGKLVYIEGKLTHRKYQDSEGKDRYITEVVASNARLLERRDSSGFQGNFPSADDEPAFVKKTTSAPADTPAEEVSDAAEDDLPF